MSIPVHFRGGHAFESRSFFIDRSRLECFESLCQAIEEEIGADLNFTCEELQTAQPVLVFELYDCVLNLESWSLAKCLRKKRKIGTDDVLSVCWPGELRSSTLADTAAALNESMHMPLDGQTSFLRANQDMQNPLTKPIDSERRTPYSFCRGGNNPGSGSAVATPQDDNASTPHRLHPAAASPEVPKAPQHMTRTQPPYWPEASDEAQATELSPHTYRHGLFANGWQTLKATLAGGGSASTDPCKQAVERSQQSPRTMSDTASGSHSGMLQQAPAFSFHSAASRRPATLDALGVGDIATSVASRNFECEQPAVDANTQHSGRHPSSRLEGRRCRKQKQPRQINQHADADFGQAKKPRSRAFTPARSKSSCHTAESQQEP